MSKTTNLSIRIDKELKEQAENLFSELGMNMTTAFNVFVRQAVRQGKIPFEISLNQPNNETIAAMEEANIISKEPSVKSYSNVDKLFKELDSWCMKLIYKKIPLYLQVQRDFYAKY